MVNMWTPLAPSTTNGQLAPFDKTQSKTPLNRPRRQLSFNVVFTPV